MWYGAAGRASSAGVVPDGAGRSRMPGPGSAVAGPLTLTGCLAAQGAPSETGRVRVSLFATCLGDRFFADATAAAVRLLRSFDVEVTFPQGQTCCGQPAWNSGHLPEARRMAAHTETVFEGSEFVVLPSGSCAAMLRCSYPALLGSTAVAERSYELAQFLLEVLDITEIGAGLQGRRLAYHHGCHALRELGQGEGPIRLLKAAGAELAAWEMDQECCGFGGLFSVKNPEVSVAMADRKLDTLPNVEAVVSADGGCLLQLESRARRRGLSLRFRSLAEVLWEARSESP